MRYAAFVLLSLAVALATHAAEPPALEKSARTLLADFTAGHYEAAAKNFDEKMMAALPPAKLAEVARQLEPQLGAFKSVREAKQMKAQGYDLVVLVSDYEKALVNVQVAFDADGKVAGLYFRPAQ
jgi:excinuclease UvrABC nuclease subunit